MKSSRNPKVDAFLEKAEKWQTEMAALRALLLGFPLTEELKWSKPCYTFQGGNVVLILPFKDSVALLLTKGALLKDPGGILTQPTENTQSARQIRFTSAAEVTEIKSLLKGYIEEAIEVEKSGREVVFKKVTDHAVPEEFQARLDEMPDLKAAYEALTPGRRRAYLLHFSGAKQSKTRASRVDKCIPQILAGKGMMD